jgi:tRNA(Ile)-lysidine synthase
MTALLPVEFEAGKPVLVGVSGGPDSLALLHHLHSLGLNLIAATFNHQLRPEAGADVDFVRSIAGQLGLPFVSDSADVTAYARANHLSIEQAARDLRYRFLFREARQAGAQAVAVGHTADDQAETVLMHFLRGSGLAGLRGMSVRVILPSFDPEIPIVRPLLAWTRAETESYCRTHDLEARFDASNADMLYFRNQLRNELLPALERYNPQIRQALVKTAMALQGDYQLLDEVIDGAWGSVIRTTGDGYVCFDLAALQGLSLALRRNLFRKAAFLLSPGERDVDFMALSRAAALKPVDIVGGMKTLLEGDQLYLTFEEKRLPSPWPQIEAPFPIRPGQVAFGNGWILNTEEIYGQVYSIASENQERFTVWLDAAIDDPGQGGLHTRVYRSGDRFEPLGMPRQSIKLAELFINLKIPRRLRAAWPLICIGDEIVWVTGLRMSERFKVTQNTRRAVKIEIKKDTGQV